MRISRCLIFLVSLSAFSSALVSCKNDSYLADPAPIKDQSFVEEFDTMQNAYNRGWRWINRSTPIGVTNWGPGPGTVEMLAYSSKGTNTGLAYSNYLATNGSNNGIISNWLISPQVMMQNGDKIVFFTKSELWTSLGVDFGARLQVNINKDGDLSVGDGEDPGKFDNILLDINPLEEVFDISAPSPTAYPNDWTRFEATITGLSNPVKGRFAFRYYLHNAGANGQGNAVGIDSVAYIGKK